MPPRKILDLSTLCLKNVAANVVRHGVHFSKIQPGSEIHHCYKTIQFLFSDQILEELRYIYISEVLNMPLGRSYCYAKEIKPSGYLGQLTAFLFRGKMIFDFSFLWPCLKFLFNEHTKQASLRIPQRFPYLKDVPDLFYEALSLCENLRSLTLQLCRTSEKLLLKLLTWNTLVKLDLLLSCCSDSVIVRAFKTCPDLQILKASGIDITDQALLCMCEDSNRTTSETVHFCKAEGMCCSLGKKLKKLVLYGTRITECGVVCALQHLPLMEEFLEGPLTENDPNRHIVAHSIDILKMACELHQQPVPILKLTTMIYDSFVSWNLINEVRKCCPFIDTEVFCKVYEPSSLRCQKSLVLAVTDTPYVDLQIPFSSIFSLLVHEPVKSFSISGYVRFCIYDDDEDVPYLAEPPVYVQYLEHISVLHVSCIGFSFGYFFTNLLSAAVNVKSLCLKGTFAEICLMDAMRVNEFASLEKVSIFYANLEEISFIDLIRRRTRLKEINYFGCRNADKFVPKHRMFAQQNNFHLDIYVGEESICKDTLIKFDLI